MKKIGIIIAASLLLVVAGLVFFTKLTLIILVTCSLAGLVLFKIAPLKISKKARIRHIRSVSSKGDDKLTA